MSKEKAGYWLGVAQNVGDALTYHILTDDTQMVIQRSVLRSRKDHHGTNKRGHFNPILDPDVALHEDNQNLMHHVPMVFESSEIPVVRRHRHMRQKCFDDKSPPALQHEPVIHHEIP
jgi:hypothetical protein